MLTSEGACAPSLPEDHRFFISDLCACLENYLPPEHVQLVYRAYLLGAEAHQGQYRKTGESYIHHPLEVARILSEYRLDATCLTAALLHDVIEDTSTLKSQIAVLFGDQVADLVDAVSKMTQIDFKNQAEAQAANLRKMLLAMTRDIRVILIKLADRLHNMASVGVMRPDKRRRIARETLDIYAPIAHRLGINLMRVQLEDLCFAAYWPWRHRVLHQAIQRASIQYASQIKEVQNALTERVHGSDGLHGEVQTRQKHLYSIYQRKLKKRCRFSEMTSIYGFRIVLDDVGSCYRALGITHNLYKPVPGRFKDYIALPKTNGYQALHTTVVGPQGVQIEIQICTLDMLHFAERGITLQWYQQSHSSKSQRINQQTSEWMQNLLELQKSSGDSIDFLDNVKIDLFPDEVYVFTPQGDIKALPRRATVLDFAYAIHSQIGNTCIGGRVQNRWEPLHTPLNNGQTVEIITSPHVTPNAGWLDFVVTGKARAAIRSYLKQLQRQEAVEIGKRLLEKVLQQEQIALSSIDPVLLRTYLDNIGLSSLETLLIEIGLGNRLPVLVAKALMNPGSESSSSGSPSPRLTIRGTEGLVVNYAKCCRPVPGDPITGLFSPGKGIVVHRRSCHNLGDYAHNSDAWLEVSWADEDYRQEFKSELRADVRNVRGVLAKLATIIFDLGFNIDRVRSDDREDMTSHIEFTISLHSLEDIDLVINRMLAQDYVLKVERAWN